MSFRKPPLICPKISLQRLSSTKVYNYYVMDIFFQNLNNDTRAFLGINEVGGTESHNWDFTLCSKSEFEWFPIAY